MHSNQTKKKKNIADVHSSLGSFVESFKVLRHVSAPGCGEIIKCGDDDNDDDFDDDDDDDYDYDYDYDY